MATIGPFPCVCCGVPVGECMCACCGTQTPDAFQVLLKAGGWGACTDIVTPDILNYVDPCTYISTATTAVNCYQWHLSCDGANWKLSLFQGDKTDPTCGTSFTPKFVSYDLIQAVNFNCGGETNFDGPASCSPFSLSHPCHCPPHTATITPSIEKKGTIIPSNCINVPCCEGGIPNQLFAHFVPTGSPSLCTCLAGVVVQLTYNSADGAWEGDVLLDGSCGLSHAHVALKPEFYSGCFALYYGCDDSATHSWTFTSPTAATPTSLSCWNPPTGGPTTITYNGITGTSVSDGMSACCTGTFNCVIATV